LLPVARPTFDVNRAERNLVEAIAALEGAGFEVLGPKALVMTEADVAAAVASRVASDAAPASSAAPAGNAAEIEILFMASFCDSTPATALFANGDFEFNQDLAPVLLWSVPEPGEVGERLLLNSMCGANLAAHALVHVGRKVRHLHAAPSEKIALTALAALRDGQYPTDATPPLLVGAAVDDAGAKQALSWLHSRVIGAIGEAPPGFTPCEKPVDSILESFGVSTAAESIPDFFVRLKGVAPAAQHAEHERALAEQPSLAQVPAGEALTVASTTVALEEYRAQTGADAIALRCWPDFAVDLGACPCSALSRLADRGTATACERDILGSLTSLILAGLGAEPTYIVDVVDIEPEANVIRIWHCGAAATQLATDPKNATQWLHCNRKLGVAGNFALRTGVVTLVRVDTDPEDANKLRMLLTIGESIAAENRFQGNTATLKVHDAKGLVNGLMVKGFPHHFGVAWGDVRAGLRGVAKAKQMELIEWA
jgi:hypothetical protein